MSDIIVSQITTKGFINKEIVSYLSQWKLIKQKRKKRNERKWRVLILTLEAKYTENFGSGRMFGQNSFDQFSIELVIWKKLLKYKGKTQV